MEKLQRDILVEREDNSEDNDLEPQLQLLMNNRTEQLQQIRGIINRSIDRRVLPLMESWHSLKFPQVICKYFNTLISKPISPFASQIVPLLLMKKSISLLSQSPTQEDTLSIFLAFSVLSCYKRDIKYLYLTLNKEEANYLQEFFSQKDSPLTVAIIYGLSAELNIYFQEETESIVKRKVESPDVVIWLLEEHNMDFEIPTIGQLQQIQYFIVDVSIQLESKFCIELIDKLRRVLPAQCTKLLLHSQETRHIRDYAIALFEPGENIALEFANVEDNSSTDKVVELPIQEAQVQASIAEISQQSQQNLVRACEPFEQLNEQGQQQKISTDDNNNYLSESQTIDINGNPLQAEYIVPEADKIGVECQKAEDDSLVDDFPLQILDKEIIQPSKEILNKQDEPSDESENEDFPLQQQQNVGQKAGTYFQYQQKDIKQLKNQDLDSEQNYDALDQPQEAKILSHPNSTANNNQNDVQESNNSEESEQDDFAIKQNIPNKMIQQQQQQDQKNTRASQQANVIDDRVLRQEELVQQGALSLQQQNTQTLLIQGQIPNIQKNNQGQEDQQEINIYPDLGRLYFQPNAPQVYQQQNFYPGLSNALHQQNNKRNTFQPSQGLSMANIEQKNLIDPTGTTLFHFSSDEDDNRTQGQKRYGRPNYLNQQAYEILKAEKQKTKTKVQQKQEIPEDTQQAIQRRLELQSERNQEARALKNEQERLRQEKIAGRGKHADYLTEMKVNANTTQLNLKEILVPAEQNSILKKISAKLNKEQKLSLSEAELEPVLYNDNLLVLGRSGTGKTTCALIKILMLQGITNQAQKGSRIDEINIVFTTLSPLLAQRIKSYVSSFTGKEFASLKDYPPCLNTLSRNHFPFITTTDDLINQIDGTLDAPFMRRDAKNRLMQDFGIDMQQRQLYRGPTILGDVTENYNMTDFQEFEGIFWKPIWNTSKGITALEAYQEIQSYITGHHLSHKYPDNLIDLDTYLHLVSENKSFLSEEQKRTIHGIATEYFQWKLRNQRFDRNDQVNYIVREIIKGHITAKRVIHYLFIDEVQDINSCTLYLFSLVTQQNFFFAGDTAQTISKGNQFRFSQLFAIFRQVQQSQHKSVLENKVEAGIYKILKQKHSQQVEESQKGANQGKDKQKGKRKKSDQPKNPRAYKINDKKNKGSWEDYADNEEDDYEQEDENFENYQKIFDDYFSQKNKNFLPPSLQCEPKWFQMTQNFRSHGRIIELSNAIIQVIELCAPESIDHVRKEMSEIEGMKPLLIRNYQQMKKLFLLNDGQDKSTKFGRAQSIIVRDNKEFYEQTLDPELQDRNAVLSVFDSKGMEFTDVLVYDFFTKTFTNPMLLRLISEMEIETKKLSEEDFKLEYQLTARTNDQNLEDDQSLTPSSFKKVVENGKTYYYVNKFIRNEKLSYEIMKRDLQKEIAILISELKELYVAVTRAKSRLIFYESEAQKPFESLFVKLGVLEVLKNDNFDEIYKKHLYYCPKSEKSEYLKMYADLGRNFMERHDYENAYKMFVNAGEERLAKVAQAQQQVYKAKDLLQKYKQQKKGTQKPEERQAIRELFEKAALIFLECEEYENCGRSMISAMLFRRAYEAFNKQQQLEQLAAKSAILVAHCAELGLQEFLSDKLNQQQQQQQQQKSDNQLPQGSQPQQPSTTLEVQKYLTFASNHYSRFSDKNNEDYENLIYTLEKLGRYGEIFQVLREKRQRLMPGMLFKERVNHYFKNLINSQKNLASQSSLQELCKIVVCVQAELLQIISTIDVEFKLNLVSLSKQFQISEIYIEPVREDMSSDEKFQIITRNSKNYRSHQSLSNYFGVGYDANIVNLLFDVLDYYGVSTSSLLQICEKLNLRNKFMRLKLGELLRLRKKNEKTLIFFVSLRDNLDFIGFPFPGLQNKKYMSGVNGSDYALLGYIKSFMNQDLANPRQEVIVRVLNGDFDNSQRVVWLYRILAVRRNANGQLFGESDKENLAYHQLLKNGLTYALTKMLSNPGFFSNIAFYQEKIKNIMIVLQDQLMQNQQFGFSNLSNIINAIMFNLWDQLNYLVLEHNMITASSREQLQNLKNPEQAETIIQDQILSFVQLTFLISQSLSDEIGPNLMKDRIRGMRFSAFFQYLKSLRRLATINQKISIRQTSLQLFFTQRAMLNAFGIQTMYLHAVNFQNNFIYAFGANYCLVPKQSQRVCKVIEEFLDALSSNQIIKDKKEAYIYDYGEDNDYLLVPVKMTISFTQSLLEEQAEGLVNFYQKKNLLFKLYNQEKQRGDSKNRKISQFSYLLPFNQDHTLRDDLANTFYQLSENDIVGIIQQLCEILYLEDYLQLLRSESQLQMQEMLKFLAQINNKFNNYQELIKQMEKDIDEIKFHINEANDQLDNDDELTNQQIEDKEKQVEGLENQLESKQKNLDILLYGRPKHDFQGISLKLQKIIQQNILNLLEFLQNQKSKDDVFESQICYRIISKLGKEQLQSLRQEQLQSQMKEKSAKKQVNLKLLFAFNAFTLINEFDRFEKFIQENSLYKKQLTLLKNCYKRSDALDACMVQIQFLDEFALPDGKMFQLLERNCINFFKVLQISKVSSIYTLKIPESYLFHCKRQQNGSQEQNTIEQVSLVQAITDLEVVQYATFFIDLLKTFLQTEDAQTKYSRERGIALLMLFMQQLDTQQLSLYCESQRNCNTLYDVAQLSGQYVNNSRRDENDGGIGKISQINAVYNTIFQQVELVQAINWQNIQNKCKDLSHLKRLLAYGVFTKIKQQVVNILAQNTRLSLEPTFLRIFFSKINQIRSHFPNQKEQQLSALIAVLEILFQNDVFQRILSSLINCRNVQVKLRRTQWENMPVQETSMQKKMKKFTDKINKLALIKIRHDKKLYSYMNYLSKQSSKRYFFYNLNSLSVLVDNSEIEKQYRTNFYRFFAQPKIGLSNAFTYFDEFVRLQQLLEQMRNRYMRAFFSLESERTEDYYFFKDRLVHISDQEKDLQKFALDRVLTYTQVNSIAEFMAGVRKYEHALDMLRIDLERWDQSIAKGLNEIKEHVAQEPAFIKDSFY